MKTKKVCITRCSGCGLERYGFRPEKTECPRCGRSGGGQFPRWISKPHPQTVADAERGRCD